MPREKLPIVALRLSPEYQGTVELILVPDVGQTWARRGPDVGQTRAR